MVKRLRWAIIGAVGFFVLKRYLLKRFSVLASDEHVVNLINERLENEKNKIKSAYDAFRSETLIKEIELRARLNRR